MSTFNNKFSEYDDDTVVKFVYEEGTDTFHFNETHVQTALEETSTVERFAEVITSGLAVDGSPLDDMRDEDLLEDYNRGDECFTEFVAGVLKENFWEMSNYLEESTETYDHKRGFTTLRAEVNTTVAELKNFTPRPYYFGLNPLSGWTAHLETPKGTLSFDV